jgi:hypothetical protein
MLVLAGAFGYLTSLCVPARPGCTGSNLVKPGLHCRWKQQRVLAPFCGSSAAICCQISAQLTFKSCRL